MIKALIFDYNGTLVDDLKYHLTAYSRTFKEIGLDIPENKIIEMLGTSATRIIRTVVEENKLDVDYKKLVVRKINLYKKLIENKEIIFPDEEKILRELSKKFLLAIFTASIRRQIVFPRVLMELFSIIIAGDEAPAFKPAPDTLLKIAKELGLKASECAYVGDLPIDMKTAKNAEMLVVGIESELCTTQKLKEAGADFVVKNLKELMELKL